MRRREPGAARLTARPRVGVVALATPENGGIFQYTQAVLEALAGRTDFEFVVFSQHDQFDVGGFEKHTVTFERRALATQLKMATAVLLGRGLPGFVPAADRRLFDSVDFFYIPSVMPYPQLFFDKPFVVTIHDLLERHFPAFVTAGDRFQRKATNRTMARRASAIICESSFVRQDLVRFCGIDAAKVSVVPAPPPAAILGAPPSEAEVTAARSRHGLAHDYLLYPAQFWAHKNHLTLVRAFARVHAAHPEIKLVLTGGRQHQFAQVVEEVRALALEPQVIFLGHLPYEDLRGIFKGARALVVPTLFESISIPVYEAFALGVPVCVSNVVGLPEQAGDAALLFDPTDPIAIAAAIERVLGDASFARQLVDNGTRRLQALMREPYGDRLAAVFRDVFATGQAS